MRHNFGVRPKCECGSECQFMGTYKKDGSPQFRNVCAKCHTDSIVKKRGLKSIIHVLAKNKGVSVSKYVKDSQTATAKRHGFDKFSEYLNAIHPYKRYRKTYCENAKGKLAGWLGFTCTNKIVAPHLQLDTDHLDGNPYNNDPDNLHTLCKTCHAIKTNMFMDYATKGRKKGKK